MLTNVTDSDDEMPHFGLLNILAWHYSADVDIPKYGQCNDLESASEFINRNEHLVLPFENGVCPGLTSDHDQRDLKLKPTMYGSSSATSSKMLINYYIKLSMWDAHIVIITFSIVLNWTIIDKYL